jgi:hypothetical protein
VPDYLRGKGWDDIPPKIEYQASSLTKLLEGVPDRTFVAGKPLTPETLISLWRSKRR